VRNRSVGVRAWARLLGLEKTVVEAVKDDDGAIVIGVRPIWSQQDRRPRCRRRCPGYDLGEGRRRWRALDLGTTLCLLEADAPRVTCKQHGVVVAAVPWARHDTWFTRSFDDTAAWLAVTLPRARSVSCCGSRGGRSGGSASVSAPKPSPAGTYTGGSRSSGLMRSRSARVRST
jgi:hypothetical protein